MPHSRTCGLRVAPLLILVCCAPSHGAALASAPPPPVPSVLARFAGFEGRITYAGHRVDIVSAPEVTGTAAVSRNGFVIEEHGPRYSLRADAGGVVVRSGATAARATDPLDADAFVYPWAVALAALASGDLHAGGRAAWRTPMGMTVYTDSSGAAIEGFTGDAGARLSFTFAGWSELAGLPFPTRVLRLRDGVTDAAFQIDRLDVVREPRQVSPPAVGAVTAAVGGRMNSTAPSIEEIRPPPVFPSQLVLTFFGLMLLAVAIVAWLRRDAFTSRLCAHASPDARGWRTSAAAAYVTPDGIVRIEGNDYHVGPEFFARAVEVSFSALFLRVSAPGLSRAIVLPRRLPRIGAQPRRRRAASAGFSLVESLVAVGFLSVVIVGAIYPALVAVAHADLAAAQKRAAIAAAANALTDEEMACAYGTSAPTGVTTTTVDSMTVTVNVTSSSVAGARDIRVTVANASGRTLAALATTVGPPVPPPGSGGAATPPPTAAPTAAPTTAPGPSATPPSSFGGR
jgi:Tfp pilus assembly protein PilV